MIAPLPQQHVWSEGFRLTQERATEVVLTGVPMHGFSQAVLCNWDFEPPTPTVTSAPQLAQHTTQCSH